MTGQGVNGSKTSEAEKKHGAVETGPGGEEARLSPPGDRHLHGRCTFTPPVSTGLRPLRDPSAADPDDDRPKPGRACAVCRVRSGVFGRVKASARREQQDAPGIDACRHRGVKAAGPGGIERRGHALVAVSTLLG
jgi:hypothetical protein